MSLTHAIYIPVILILGAALGYVLGARAGRSQALRQQARARE